MRLNARTAPYADTGSPSSARRYAPTTESFEARPTGLTCLAMQQVGAVKSDAMRYAASRSSRSSNVGVRALELDRIRERARAVGGLAVEGGALMRSSAVRQVTLLLEHDRELLRKRTPLMWLRYAATSASYAATIANASAANRWRVSGVTPPMRRSSSRTWV